MLLPHGAAQRLARCAATSDLLHSGSAGSFALHCVQHSGELCPAARQAAPQTRLQRHILPPGDDLPAAGYHAGELRVLGSITGKPLLSVCRYLADLMGRISLFRGSQCKELHWLHICWCLRF